MADSEFVYVRKPDGGIARMASAEFQADPQNFLKQGYVPIPQADVPAAIAQRRAALLQASQEAERRAKAATVPGMAETAVEGFTSGAVDALTAIPRAGSALHAHLTGGEDPLAEMTGRKALETGAYALSGGGTHGAAVAQDYAANQRARATENPITAGGSAIAGQIAGAGGLGALGRGVGGAVTSRLGGGVAARIAGAAVTGAVEGAPLGLVQAQDQAYIENRQLTGEQAMASLGVGALLGGAVGAGTKGLGEVFGAAKEKAAQYIARGSQAGASEERTAVQKILRTGDEDINRTIRGTLGEEAQPKAAEYLREGYKRGGLAEVQATEQGEAARALRSHINELETGTKNLSPEWREAKASNVAKTIARDEASVATQTELANEQLSTIRSKLDEMRADPAAYGDRATLNKLDRFATVAERDVGKAVEAGRPEDAFVALDNLKRKMGPLARPGRMLSVASDAAASQEVRGLYDGLRDALTHDAWGEAGAMQREVNGAYEKWLGTKDLFDQRFMTQTGREGWQKTYGADPGKIESFVGGLGKSRNDLTNSIVDQHIQSTKELAEALSKAGELTPEKAAELKSIRAAADRFEKRSTDITSRMSAMEQASAVLDKAKEGHGILGAGALGHMVGGGPIGTLAGVALGAATNPAKFMTQRLALEQAAAKAEKIAGKSLDAFFAGAREVAEKVPAVARKAPATAPIPTALELFQGKHATPELAYHQRVAELQRANSNYGQALRAGAERSFGTLAADDPHAVNAAVVAGSKGVQALLTAIPVGTFNPKSLTPNASKPTPTRLEIQQYADVWTAIMKPMEVVKQIPSGNVTVPQMKAIQQTYPALYGWLKQETLARLAKMDADGVEMPIHAIDTLDVLLDLGDAAGPTYATSFAVKYSLHMGDAAAKARQPKPPRPSAKGSVGQRLAAGTSLTMMGGQ